MIMYLKVVVIVAMIIGIQGQKINSHHEKYLKSIASKWSSAYLPDPDKLNSTVDSACMEAMREFNHAISHPGEDGLWALSMVDSWGKFKDGFFYGTPHHLGAYDQCLRLASPDNTIRGKYCSIFKPSLWASRDTSPVEWEEDHLQWTTQNGQLIRQPIHWRGQSVDEVMRGFSRDFFQKSNRIFEGKNHTLNNFVDHKINGSVRIPALPIPHPYKFLTYGTCIPHICTKEQLGVSILNEHLAAISPWPMFCDEPEWEISLDTNDIMFISFCSVIGVLMLAGTVTSSFILFSKQDNLAKGPLRFILPFSVPLNLKKVFAINPNPAPGTITCLNGMRMMSMCWVIYGHQHLFTLLATANEVGLNNWIDNLLFQVIQNASVSVDSFFFMSGLLVCYGVMREIKKTGKFNIIMYYVHRIIRLTPPIMFVVWYFQTLNRFTVRGPIPFSYSQRGDSFAQYCRDYGWRDFTYVSNIGFPDDETFPMGCLGQCWYTSVDTQLYVLGPLVLLPLYYSKSIGRVWVYLVTLVAIAMRGFITWNMRNKDEGGNPWLYDNYFSTWTRADSWLIGVWTGYFISNMGKKKLALKQWQVVLGWTVAVVFSWMVLLGRYHGTYAGTATIMYEMIHRTVWASCLAWLTVACHYGYGGIVNEFLSHPSWQPFSRLTYTIYLVAIPVQFLYTNASRTLFYFSHTNKIIETVGVLFFCTLFGLVVTLTVEAPILGLEKLLLNRPGRSTDEAADKKVTATSGLNNQEPASVTNQVPVPTTEKTLPPGYMRHAETYGGAKGHDNVAFESSEKESIPLKDMLLKQSTELGPQQQQEAAVGWSVPAGRSDSEPHQGAATTTHVTVELEQHNKDPSS